jgi:hypothetical protein
MDNIHRQVDQLFFPGLAFQLCFAQFGQSSTFL